MTPSAREEIEKLAEEIVKYVFDCVQNRNSSMAHQFVEAALLTQVAKARAEEREKLAQFMLARNFSTGHGDTIEDLLKELDWNINKLEKE